MPSSLHDHVETLLTQTREAVEPWMGGGPSTCEAHPRIEQVDPSEKRFMLYPSDAFITNQRGRRSWLQLEATVHQNAQTYFEQARKHKDKLRGAECLERTETDLRKRGSRSRTASHQVALHDLSVSKNGCGSNVIADSSSMEVT